jgi:hypothetical protein
MTLDELDAEQLAHEIRVPDLGGKTEQCGRLLRVEDRCKRRSCQGQQRLDVLARRMQEFRASRVAERCGQRSAVRDRERVDQGDIAGDGHRIRQSFG